MAFLSRMGTQPLKYQVGVTIVALKFTSQPPYPLSFHLARGEHSANSPPLIVAPGALSIAYPQPLSLTLTLYRKRDKNNHPVYLAKEVKLNITSSQYGKAAHWGRVNLDISSYISDESVNTFTETLPLEKCADSGAIITVQISVRYVKSSGSHDGSNPVSVSRPDGSNESSRLDFKQNSNLSLDNEPQEYDDDQEVVRRPTKKHRKHRVVEDTDDVLEVNDEDNDRRLKKSRKSRAPIVEEDLEEPEPPLVNDSDDEIISAPRHKKKSKKSRRKKAVDESVDQYNSEYEDEEKSPEIVFTRTVNKASDSRKGVITTNTRKKSEVVQSMAHEDVLNDLFDNSDEEKRDPIDIASRRKGNKNKEIEPPTNRQHPSSSTSSTNNVSSVRQISSKDVFSASLKESYQFNPKDSSIDIPILLHSLLLAFEKVNGFVQPSVFKIAGDPSKVENLKNSIMQNQDGLSLTRPIMEKDANVIASVIKLYLHSITDGVIAEKHHNTVNKIGDCDDDYIDEDDENPQVLFSQFLPTLPKSARSILLRLVHLFQTLTNPRNVSKNKLEISTLCTNFAPNVIKVQPNNLGAYELFVRKKNAGKFLEYLTKYSVELEKAARLPSPPTSPRSARNVPTDQVNNPAPSKASNKVIDHKVDSSSDVDDESVSISERSEKGYKTKFDIASDRLAHAKANEQKPPPSRLHNTVQGFHEADLSESDDDSIIIDDDDRANDDLQENPSYKSNNNTNNRPNVIADEKDATTNVTKLPIQNNEKPQEKASGSFLSRLAAVGRMNFASSPTTSNKPANAQNLVELPPDSLHSNADDSKSSMNHSNAAASMPESVDDFTLDEENKMLRATIEELKRQIVAKDNEKPTIIPSPAVEKALNLRLIEEKKTLERKVEELQNIVENQRDKYFAANTNKPKQSDIKALLVERENEKLQSRNEITYLKEKCSLLESQLEDAKDDLTDKLESERKIRQNIKNELENMRDELDVLRQRTMRWDDLQNEFKNLLDSKMVNAKTKLDKSEKGIMEILRLQAEKIAFLEKTIAENEEILKNAKLSWKESANILTEENEALEVDNHYLKKKIESMLKDLDDDSNEQMNANMKVNAIIMEKMRSKQDKLERLTEKLERSLKKLEGDKALLQKELMMAQSKINEVENDNKSLKEELIRSGMALKAIADDNFELKELVRLGSKGKRTG